MREIGTLHDPAIADRFVNFIRSKNIEAEVREEGDQFEIWVWAEDDLAESKRLFAEFKKNPYDPIYLSQAKEGVRIKKTTEKEEKKFIQKQTRLKKKVTRRAHPINATLGLIIASGIIYWLDNQSKGEAFRLLAFSLYSGSGFPEILSGQIWRLFTPILLHANIWHLLFNMMWLFQLGQMLERERGALYMIYLVLLSSGLANIGQYLVSGGNFVGMSGVVFALFGFVWAKSRLEFNQNYFLSPFTVGFILVYYLLCVWGFFGNIANTNHGVGLCVGMVWGFFSTGYLKNIRSLKKLTTKELMVGLLPFALTALGVISDVSRY